MSIAKKKTYFFAEILGFKGRGSKQLLTKTPPNRKTELSEPFHTQTVTEQNRGHPVFWNSYPKNLFGLFLNLLPCKAKITLQG